MKKTKKGFTLIELLVVIAIIGLLSTLSILALNTARARSRDARRLADVRQIQTALEMYFNDMGAYPTTASPTASIGTTNGTYLRAIPTPPTPVDGSACGSAAPAYTYAYVATSGEGGTYTLRYCLGAAVNDVPAGHQTATPAGIR